MGYTDIPCACADCGIVYANARDRLAESKDKSSYRAPEYFLDQAHGNEFEGRICDVCGSVRRMYRLLAGPLFVPRA